MKNVSKESDKLGLELIPFDIATIMDNCKNTVMAEATAKNLLMTFKIEHPVGKYLIGDSSKLTQICINLLSNAIKFTDEGVIKCYVTTADTNITETDITLCFEFIDSGVGMSSEQIEKVLNTLPSGNIHDCAEKHKYNHDEIRQGLYIALSLIQAMGGELAIKSVVGLGSKFSFVLTFQTIDKSENTEIPFMFANKAPLISQPSKERITITEDFASDNKMNQNTVSFLDSDPFYQEMKLHFVEHNQDTYANIEAAISQGDMNKAFRLTHNLKSNAGHIKRPLLQNAAKELEQELANKNASPHLVEKVKQELERVLEELAPLLTSVFSKQDKEQ